MAKKADKDTEARRWKRELDIAGRREKDWRTEGEKIVSRYRGEERKKGRYNVLWSNTEILRPSLYNSPAKPDVRRRFRDADPLGKAVSTVLERCLDIIVEGPDVESSIKNDVLDGLLAGRGVTRIRYVARIGEKPLEADPEKASLGDTADSSEEDEEQTPDEELQDERVEYEHIDWRDFRHGYGRVWAEVEWIAFRCKLTRAEATKMLGEDAISEVEFTEQSNDDEKRRYDTVGETQKLAEFWNVWDRVGKREFFTQENCDALLYTLENPDGEPSLDLVDFWPIAEPLKLIENTGSLDPIPPFQLYRDQADELDRISLRMMKIVEAIRVRGAYDARLAELADIVDSGDNQLTPVQNAAPWQEGGLDKAISWLPIEPQAKVLAVLNETFSETKQKIDEITGISDIIRGASIASETATAQQIKSNYANIRLQRMRGEVERYVRDLLRKAAEVISDKFGADTLQKMTQLQFPTQEQKMQAQFAMQQAQQMGQPPPPNLEQVLQLPTWDDILGVLRSDSTRGYKVDVETDSTVAGSLESDMQGMSQVLGAITTTLQGLAPLVQAGAMPIEAAKELVLSIARRAKLGLSVEDALEKLQAPPPPQQPAEPPDSAPQVAQIKAQSDQQVAQLKAQTDQQIAGTQAQRDVAMEGKRQEEETNRERMRLAFQAAEGERSRQHEVFIHASTQQADAQQAEQQRAAEQERAQQDFVKSEAKDSTKNQVSEISQRHQALEAAVKELSAPKKPVKRVGKVKLPSGGTMEFEIGDAQEKSH